MNYIKIGYVTKPHGIRGEMKVFPLTDDKNRFKYLKNVFFQIDQEFKEFNIVRVKVAPDFIIINLKNIDTAEQALVFKNSYLFIERSDAAALNENEYYTQDLVGCSFWYNERFLGNVEAVINEGASDVFVVSEKGTEVYFPFLNELIEKIDISEKKIFVKDIEGYFD